MLPISLVTKWIRRLRVSTLVKKVSQLLGVLLGMLGVAMPVKVGLIV